MLKTIHSPDQTTFCDLLKAQREAAGISQVELGLRLGWEQTHVSRAERGARRLDVLELRIWLQALGVELGDFVAQLEARLAAAAVAKRAPATRRPALRKRT